MPTIGMSVNVPKNNSQRISIQRLIVALETAGSFARECELWFEGREAAPVFEQLCKQLDKLLKDS